MPSLALRAIGERVVIRKELSLVISSLVVETLPGRADGISRALERISGVEVHEVQGCKLVVTIEADSTEASHATASSFAAVEGVASVSLVYVNFEDETLGAGAAGVGAAGAAGASAAGAVGAGAGAADVGAGAGVGSPCV